MTTLLKKWGLRNCLLKMNGLYYVIARLILGVVHKLRRQDFVFFDHLPPLTFSMVWMLTKSGHFWLPPTYLVNVVCEQPLISWIIPRNVFCILFAVSTYLSPSLQAWGSGTWILNIEIQIRNRCHGNTAPLVSCHKRVSMFP